MRSCWAWSRVALELADHLEQLLDGLGRQPRPASGQQLD
jgi:hypothetical protein